MNRRRNCICLALLLVIAGGVGAWAWFASRESDFIWIGPKTRGVRTNLETLDMTIDAADFRDCKTVRDVLGQLHDKIAEREREFFVFWNPHVLGEDEPDIRLQPVHFPAQSQPMTVKQLLRQTFKQATKREVVFIVGRFQIEATTPDAASARHAVA